MGQQTVDGLVPGVVEKWLLNSYVSPFLEDPVEEKPSLVKTFSENVCLENFFLVTVFLASVSSEKILLEKFSQVNVSLTRGLRDVLGRAFLESAFLARAFLERAFWESAFLESVASVIVFDGMVCLERWHVDGEGL